ncbi:MAG: hypothetical protein DRO94_00560 [Candidatus Altiarchaeales archaeon]|nr:MAG: hypothetical protein DRO94_00560 [Candidatus Altiarchaeales archaeon]
MDRGNFVTFILILVIMTALVHLNMSSSGLNSIKGRPAVAPPFVIGEDYNISIDENGIIVYLSREVADRYNGIYLAVYAYDEDGKYITKLKRVVNGKIFISNSESADFEVTFDDNLVKDIETPRSKEKFYKIVEDAMANDRNYGLGRCLLGRQCEKICPMRAITLIRDDSIDGRGRIIPRINLRNGKIFGDNLCIEDGLCSSVCPTSLIHLAR